MDLYTQLGVHSTASNQEIKHAYRKLARQHHPDSGGDPERFKQINHAYQVLGDEARRREYDHDRVQQSFSNGVQFDDESIHDFFQDIFGSAAGFRHSYSTPLKNRDLRATVNVDLSSIVQPQKRTIHTKTGRNERTVEVEIPAGVNDGATIRYKGYGQDTLTRVPPGDLVVVVRVRNNRGFSRNLSDLHCDIRVDAVSAMLGTEMEFVNLDNKRIRVVVPAGVQHGQQLRISGRGLPGSAGVGDLLLTVRISIPENLSEMQKNLLEQFKKG